MSKVWIIEPHCDDILFSCPELLMQNEEVCVTTFHHSQDRPNTIYNTFGPHIRCMTLPVHEIGSGYAGSFHNNRPIWKTQINIVYDQLHQFLDVYDILRKTYPAIYVPFGIKHPHHIVISNYFTWYLTGITGFTYYMDRPYYDVSPPEIYARPIHGEVQTVDTPEWDRHDMMMKLLDKQFWIGKMQGVANSVYLRKELT